MSKEKILVHACCATCAGYVIEKLSPDYNSSVYFFNPNIHPDDEYLLRKNELEKYAHKMGIPYFEEPYTPSLWFSRIKGLETEPEKGSRCTECFLYRLEQTAAYALENNFRIFTTTLTISPHKNSRVIIETGQNVAAAKDLIFLPEDFKKKNGFLKTMEIAKKENFYRQDYCGCIFSKNNLPS